jgi:hypothetical protein
MILRGPLNVEMSQRRPFFQLVAFYHPERLWPWP